MYTVRAVTEELLHFVFVEYFGFRKQYGGFSSPLPLHTVDHSEATLPISKIFDTLTPSQGVEEAQAGNILYVSVGEALLFTDPVATFDGVLARLPYGVHVSYITSSNRWYKVQYKDLEGWILRENVVEGKVTPQFLLGEYYGPEHAETVKLRASIEDAFFAAMLHIPMQNVEYVTYKILRKGKEIPWTSDRPRTPGRWQQLLRGQDGVYINVLPKTDAIMEIVHEDGTGHVAYVDAVFPDRSILISEVGYPEEGHYSERTLPQEEWREMRPIFIAIT